MLVRTYYQVCKCQMPNVSYLSACTIMRGNRVTKSSILTPLWLLHNFWMATQRKDFTKYEEQIMCLEEGFCCESGVLEIKIL